MPSQFTDSANNTWNLRLNLYMVQQADQVDYSQYTKEKFTLLQHPEKVVHLIYGNPALMWSLVFYLLYEQIEEKFKGQLSDEEGKDVVQSLERRFAKNLDGSCTDAARSALIEGLGDFFPDAKTALSTLNLKYGELRKKTEARLMSMLPKMDEAVDRELDRILTKSENDMLRELGEISKSL